MSPSGARSTAKSNPSMVILWNTGWRRSSEPQSGSATTRRALAGATPSAPVIFTSVSTTASNPSRTSPTWARGPSRPAMWRSMTRMPIQATAPNSSTASTSAIRSLRANERRGMAEALPMDGPVGDARNAAAFRRASWRPCLAP